MLWFRTCGYFPACTYDSLRLFPNCLHNHRDYSFVPSGIDGFRYCDHGLLDWGCLVRPLVPDRYCEPLKRITTCAVICSNMFVFSVDNRCRGSPHVQNDGPSALCQCFLVFCTTPLCVHSLPHLFFDTKADLLQASDCKMVSTQFLIRSTLFCC